MAALLSLVLLPSVCSAQTKLSPFAPISVSNQPKSKADFLLANTKVAAPIYVDSADFPVVRLAAEALANDIQSVTGTKSSVLSSAPAARQSAVFVGTLGKSRLIDDLVARKKLDVTSLRGGWETFLITTVENPVPGVAQGLVIIGSDRRGTAYGLFSVSESIGVSPWVWWADVTPAHRDSLVLSAANYRSQTPSVKYRGIFINDEDWGIQPWASKTFETDPKDIGPKTYAKVCELLLRLKANYLWPAMHHTTKAFNLFPQNKVVADQYAIVMGSSHAEPMLRNNVTEWDGKTRGAFNYITNRDQVLKYWDERVQTNAPYENVYTLGMRGIHDSPMEGDGTTAEKVARLEDIFAQQRAMLQKHVNPNPTLVPQVFVPYKEVLELYQNGLKVPDDVTLMWVDDNFGYIRQLSNATEQKRKGGSGVYYHFSYLGPPQEYLWLGSTSPALTAYEMGKAYAYGADKVWVFNVGDIKPIEKEMEFGLRLAYDVNRYPVEKAMSFLTDWSTATFGPENSKEIASILKEYYQLTGQTKPEHISRVNFTETERKRRLTAYDDLMKQAEALYGKLPQRQRDAFFQLVLYPVKGAALIEQKRDYSVWGDAQKAIDAYDQIQQITDTYNTKIAGGKWNNMMNSRPHNLSVFARPDAQKLAIAPTPATPLYQLEPKDAQLSGAMKQISGALVGTDPAQQVENNGNTAKFVVNSPEAQQVSIYFLANCLDNKQDSWFVKVNDKRISTNDHLTGKSFAWVKIMDAQLREGPNELIIEQREAGAAVKQVAIMKAGTTPVPAPKSPDFSFDAIDYSAAKNTRTSQWKKVEGLGGDKAVMTLLPYQTPSISDKDVAKAPCLSYSFRGTFSKCTVEPRFLPTHRANSQTGLRYAVQVDDGPVQIRDIDSLEFSSEWGINVLNGYASAITEHNLNGKANHTVTISLLDPGLVLSEVRVFAGPATNEATKHALRKFLETSGTISLGLCWMPPLSPETVCLVKITKPGT